LQDQQEQLVAQLLVVLAEQVQVKQAAMAPMDPQYKQMLQLLQPTVAAEEVVLKVQLQMVVLGAQAQYGHLQ
jgi:type IV secretory pathway VirB2 component (pilin)